MKHLSAAMRQHLAQPYQTTSSCWLIKRADGTVLAFTDHDQDLTFDLEGWLITAGIPVTAWISGTGSQTYKASSGYMPSDIATAGALNVDNMEIYGVLVSPSITEADLNAGLWDAAEICNFYINWNAPGLLPLTTLNCPGTTASATAAAPHGMNASFGTYYVQIFGATPSVYNGVHSATITGPSTFTYPLGAHYAAATGTTFYQVIYGAVIERIGKLGEVAIERGMFKAELRGLMQAYTRQIGEIVSPMCRADLGDSKCKVNLVPFTVTGTVTGVNADGVTIYDSGRTEPGPTGGIAISTISKANPGRVTLVSTFDWPVGSGVVISGCLGMTAVNGDTIVRNPDYPHGHFDLGVDTTSYPTYTGGGIAYPLGATSGYFDYGVITFTSGANSGLSMEVKNYAPGTIVLQLPMPYAVAPGDTYSMVAGCDKSLVTCRDRFSNIINMRAEPYLPGIDKLVQVGRHG